MRCRAGDLAVLIRADDPRNLHRLVEVLHSIPHPTREEAAWVVQSLGAPFVGVFEIGPQAISRGSCLLPLRDKPGVDETLLNLELIV